MNGVRVLVPAAAVVVVVVVGGAAPVGGEGKVDAVSAAVVNKWVGGVCEGWSVQSVGLTPSEPCPAAGRAPDASSWERADSGSRQGMAG